MKKSTFILFLFLSFLTEGQAQTCSGIVNIPDPNFKNALLNHFPVIDTNYDGEIQCSEANNYPHYIRVQGRGILDLTGIEAFVNIVELEVRNNALSNLNISTLTNLQKLYCSYNSISELSIINNINLYIIDCSHNELFNIDLSGCLNVKYLYCDYNNLTTLAVNECHDLLALNCRKNQLQSLDLTGAVSLKSLRCSDNYWSLEELNLKNGNNQIIELVDLKYNYNLNCVLVDDENYSSANWTQIDPQTTFSEISCKRTNLTAAYCGVQLTDINSVIECESVVEANLAGTNSKYKFVFENASDPNEILVIGRKYPNVNVQTVPGIQFNTTYNVTVEWRNSLGNWMPAGDACQVTTPENTPTTQLTYQFCNTVVTDLSAMIECEPVALANLAGTNSKYKFTLVNISDPNDVHVIARKYPNCNLAVSAPGISNNATYNVTVQWRDANGNWMPEGDVCQLTIVTPNMMTGSTNSRNTAQMRTTEMDVVTYPNPNEGRFTIAFVNDEVKNADYCLLDNLGRVVAKGELINGQALVELENWTKGFYVLKVDFSEETILKKLYIE